MTVIFASVSCFDPYTHAGNDWWQSCDTPLLSRDGVLMQHCNVSVLPSVSIHKPVTAGNCSHLAFLPSGLATGNTYLCNPVSTHP